MKCQNFLKGPGLLLLLTFFSASLFAQDCKYQALIDKMDKAMMEKNADRMAEFYHTDAVRHTQEGTVEGLEKIKEQTAEFYKNVPDAEGKNLDIICQGDYAVVRWEGKGTPKGAPKMLSVTGITIYKMKDGKIAEEWEEMNSLSMMMQMGYELKEPAKD
ncbi:MAG: nuclear transport factor 2 family protein [Lewinellaceae bacterium]|nr:nuclear transport factor 2 family protein [Lewinellaceae bacterium]